MLMLNSLNERLNRFNNDKIIDVKTIDQHTHSLDIHFKHNYVNDGFEWKFKKVNGKHKKDGYTLSNGENHILGELVSW